MYVNIQPKKVGQLCFKEVFVDSKHMDFGPVITVGGGVDYPSLLKLLWGVVYGNLPRDITSVRRLGTVKTRLCPCPGYTRKHGSTFV